MEDDRIILEPGELTVPFQVSVKTLYMMDEAVRDLREGKRSDTLDLSEFEE